MDAMHMCVTPMNFLRTLKALANGDCGLSPARACSRGSHDPTGEGMAGDEGELYGTAASCGSGDNGLGVHGNDGGEGPGGGISGVAAGDVVGRGSDVGGRWAKPSDILSSSSMLPQGNEIVSANTSLMATTVSSNVAYSVA